MKCWNCDGLGLIHKLDEDDPTRDSMVYGDPCPICEHGKISFQKWLKYHLVRFKYHWFYRMNCWNCNGIGLVPGYDDEGYYIGDLDHNAEPCPICNGDNGKVNYWKWLKYKLSRLNYYNLKKFLRLNRSRKGKK